MVALTINVLYISCGAAPGTTSAAGDAADSSCAPAGTVYECGQTAPRNLDSMRSARAIAAGVLLLLGGCAYFSKHAAQGACRNDLGSPIRDFCAESPAIWRGGRLNRTDVSWLLAHGVGTVINLELVLGDQSVFEGAQAPPGTHEVQYFRVADYEPVHVADWSLLDNHVAHFIAIIAEAPKPVYVHCRYGLDRTGVFIAAYRVLVEDANPETEISELARYRTPWLPIDAPYIRSLRDERRADILRTVAAWRARLKPTARIECDRGACRYLRL